MGASPRALRDKARAVKHEIQNQTSSGGLTTAESSPRPGDSASHPQIPRARRLWSRRPSRRWNNGGVQDDADHDHDDAQRAADAVRRAHQLEEAPFHRPAPRERARVGMAGTAAGKLFELRSVISPISSQPTMSCCQRVVQVD